MHEPMRRLQFATTFYVHRICVFIGNGKTSGKKGHSVLGFNFDT